MSRRQAFGLAGLLFVIALLTVVDVVDDYREGISVPHLLLESTIFASAVTALGWVLADYLRARNRLRELARSLAAVEAERDRWHQSAERHLEGLAAAIDEQFDRWGLTGAEKEVALLLLKGLSFKEIADARGTSERTVRQQALTVYRKSSLGGRAALAAFFLEDLLLPTRRSAPETE